MGAFSRAFSAARDGVNARRAEGRRPSNDARFDKKTENSIDKHRFVITSFSTRKSLGIIRMPRLLVLVALSCKPYLFENSIEVLDFLEVPSCLRSYLLNSVPQN